MAFYFPFYQYRKIKSNLSLADDHKEGNYFPFSE